MEQGLAHQMTYGEGKGQNTMHYYAGTKTKVKSKAKNVRKNKKSCNK